MKRRNRLVRRALALTVCLVAGFAAATGALGGAFGSTSTSTSSSSTSSTSTSSTSSTTTTTSSTSSTTSTTTTTTTTTTGSEGCTPGYWKQPQHFDSWPVDVSTTLAGAGFTDTGYGSSTTLLEALSFKGGPTVQDAKNILLRAAAAAYLNSLALGYPLTTAGVLAEVNAALASGDRSTILAEATRLDAFNNGGCTLS